MAITKRTRFEVLKRDNYTCRYCHATDTELTIDHVVPTALGGSDDPSNLVAACKDCNAGKAASNPDADLVANVGDDAVRWAAAMRAATGQWLTARQGGFEYGDAVARAWDDGNDGHRWGRAHLPGDWADTVEHWRTTGIPVELVTDAVGIAMRRKTVKNPDVWRYVCGVVWNKLTELQEAAAASLSVDRQPGRGAGRPCPVCHLIHDEACNYWGGWRTGVLDCSLTRPSTAEAQPGHPDHYQMMALSLVVDAPAHEWAKSWPYPSELYPIYSGRSGG